MAEELSWRSKPLKNEDFTTKNDSADKRASFFGNPVTPARNALTNGGKSYHVLK